MFYIKQSFQKQEGKNQKKHSGRVFVERQKLYHFPVQLYLHHNLDDRIKYDVSTFSLQNYFQKQEIMLIFWNGTRFYKIYC